MATQTVDILRDQRDEAIRDMILARPDMTLPEIEQHFNVSGSVITRVRLRFNLPHRSPGRPRKKELGESRL